MKVVFYQRYMLDSIIRNLQGERGGGGCVVVGCSVVCEGCGWGTRLVINLYTQVF